MIRTESEYRKALEQLKNNSAYLTEHRKHLQSIGIKDEQLERALQPALSFHEQLSEEVETYGQMRRGELGTLSDLTNIGRWLIGVRIAKGLTQKELAERLGVSEAQVSRDERGEYHGVTVERAQYILRTMGVELVIEGDIQKTEEPVQSHLAPPPISVGNQFFAFMRASRKLNPEKAKKLAEKFEREFEEAVASTQEGQG
jgi:transcriptional regulator with XRE-family HTH domain